VTVVWLWEAPPRCGVSGSLEKAQEAAGMVLAAGSALTARVEAARLGTSAGTLEPTYVRTGQARQARRADGGIRWEPFSSG
jgi:hypothetical protein